MTVIQRYYQVLTANMDAAKQIENCFSEDKEFYQDVCMLLATKIKAIQAELADLGLVICHGNS